MPLRLVLVEDHLALREGLELLLGRDGIEVLGTAGSATDGRELVERLKPDVALIDIRLGEESGIELTAQLIDADPERRIVLYTGSNEIELLIKGLDSGARGYALKAGSMDELMAAIERVAGGGSYVDPRLDRILLSPRATAHVPQLSPREREIMHLMAEGMTAEAIGDKISVSVETVRTHVRNVIRKLQARNRVHAIAIALERGEIALDSSHDDR
jgi:DNA-binding NarL/FixJ family response regulator